MQGQDYNEIKHKIIHKKYLFYNIKFKKYISKLNKLNMRNFVIYLLN